MSAIAELLEGLTLALVAGVGGVGLVLILAMFLAWRSAKQRLLQLDLAVYEGTDPHPLSGALRRELVRKLAEDRYLLREHPDVTIEGWLERSVLHRFAFEAGGWITGFALICTFFLIALVLAEDVGPAIRDTSNMTGLSEAVRKMGAKFVVSMLGIGLTVVHGAFRSWFSGDLHNRASEVSARLAQAAIVLSDHAVLVNERAAVASEQMLETSKRTAEKISQIFGVMQAQHQATSDRMDELAHAVKSLGSIEVSVRDIGSELAVRLQQAVRNDIVAGIRKDLEEVTDRLCDALADSFAKTVHEQLVGVTAELQKIEAAISSQAHGQVEELLNKLGDAVSGGFTSESSRMKDALARFVEVVPLLEQQMRTLIHNAGEDMAKRGAETARVSEALVGQLERVLTGIDEQQRSSASLGEQMAAFVAQTEETLARSVVDAQAQMAARSKVDLDELTTAVRTATREATDVYRTLVKEVHDAATVLRSARTETAETAQQLGKVSVSVREITRHVNDSMSSLRSVSDSLGKNVDAAQGTIRDGAQAVRGTVDVMRQQQQFVEDLSGRWPQLTRDYLEASNAAFQRVAEAWSRHVAGIEQSVGRISNGFTDSASEFAGAVEELGAQLQELKQVVQPGTVPRARTP